jgi:hypothetical protein
VRVLASPATTAGSTPGAQTTTACPSMSMPRRPARPVSWVYSPGVTSTCASPFHFTSRSRTTVRAGMLMPSASVSVANTALTRPRTKHSSTVSLNAGTSPAWCAATPASSPSRHSQKPSTCRSSSGSEPVRRSMTSAIAERSTSSVSRIPDPRHWCTAASQPFRLNTKVITGSSPARSSRSMTSDRDGGRYRGLWLPPRTLAPPPPDQESKRRSCSCTYRTSSGSTTARPRSRVDSPRGVCSHSAACAAGRSANRSKTRPPTSMCCHSGIGRTSLTTTWVSPRTVTSQSANSSALLTVADSDTSRTCSGRWMITSSQTAPRNRSAR